MAEKLVARKDWPSKELVVGVIHSIRRNLCAAVAAMFQEHKCVTAMVLITSSTSAVIAVQWLSFSASEQLIFAMPVTRIIAMSRKCQNMLCLNVLPVCIINSCLSVFSISFNYFYRTAGSSARWG